MNLEDVLDLIEEGDTEVIESYKSWCQYYNVSDNDPCSELDFCVDYSTGLWR